MSEDERPGAPRDPHEEPVGTAAEEAVKLFGALADWARDHGSDLGSGVASAAGHAARAAREVDEHLATSDPECRYCPLCRTVHLVRQTSPEVRAHLASAATSLMQAAAGLLAAGAPPEGRPHSSSSVERIDLDTEPDHPDTSPAEEDL